MEKILNNLHNLSMGKILDIWMEIIPLYLTMII